MAASRRMNLATGSEVAPSTPYLVVPSPQTLPPAVTSIPEREVLAANDLVPVAEDAQVPVEEDVQVRAVLVRAPAVDVIDYWSQTWAMTSQRSRRSIPSQPLRQCRLCPLNFRLSNNNNGGSLLKRRRRGCMIVPWLELNRCKVSSRSLPLSRAHRFTRYVEPRNL